MRRDYILSRRWLCFCMVLFGYKWSLHHRGFVTSISCLYHVLNMALNVDPSWSCCVYSIIQEHLSLGLLQLWMVKTSALTGETCGVPFVIFLFLIELSSSVKWSLIGIDTSVIIVLLIRRKSIRSMMYHKDAYSVEYSLVDAIVLSRADVLSYWLPAMPLSNICREVFDNSQQLFDNLIAVCR